MTRKTFLCILVLILICTLGFAYIVKQERSRQRPIELTPAERPEVTFMLQDNYAYRQDDDLWGGELIGDTEDTLYGYGCTIASVAVAASNLTQTRITPQMMNDNLAKQDGFTDRGWLIWSKVSNATNGRVSAQYISQPSHDIIDKCMVGGGYPVVKIKLRGSIIHWVTIVGMSTEGYLIRDSLVGSPGDLPIQLSDRSDAIHAVRCIKPVG